MALNGLQLKVWLYLYWRSDKNDTEVVTLPELEAATGNSRTRLSGAKTALVKMGYAEKVGEMASGGKFAIPILKMTVPSRSTKNCVSDQYTNWGTSDNSAGTQNMDLTSTHFADATNCGQYVEGFTAQPQPVEGGGVVGDGQQQRCAASSSTTTPTPDFLVWKDKGWSGSKKDSNRVSKAIGRFALPTDEELSLLAFIHDTKWVLSATRKKLAWLADRLESPYNYAGVRHGKNGQVYGALYDQWRYSLNPTPPAESSASPPTPEPVAERSRLSEICPKCERGYLECPCPIDMDDMDGEAPTWIPNPNAPRKLLKMDVGHDE